MALRSSGSSGRSRRSPEWAGGWRDLSGPSTEATVRVPLYALPTADPDLAAEEAEANDRHDRAAVGLLRAIPGAPFSRVGRVIFGYAFDEWLAARRARADVYRRIDAVRR